MSVALLLDLSAGSGGIRPNPGFDSSSLTVQAFQACSLFVPQFGRGGALTEGWIIQMTQANDRAALDAGRAWCLHIRRHWPGTSERGCWLIT